MITVSLDRICEIERMPGNEKWSLMHVVESISTGLRFTDLNTLAYVCGYEDFQALRADNQTIEDITNGIMAFLKDMGFTTDSSPAESQSPNA